MKEETLKTLYRDIFKDCNLEKINFVCFEGQN